MITARRILTTLALSTAMALGVSGIAVASASAAVTIEKAGKAGALANGSEIKGFSSNLTFTTPEGALECSENTLEGTLTSNGTEPAEGSIEKGSFTGPAGAECKTSFLGEPTAKITPTGLPWLLKVFANGETELTGTPKIDFTAELSNGLTCGYEAAVIHNELVAFNASPLEDKVVEQEMTGEAGNSFLCPASGKLNGTFTLTSKGEEIEAV